MKFTLNEDASGVEQIFKTKYFTVYVPTTYAGFKQLCAGTNWDDSKNCFMSKIIVKDSTFNREMTLKEFSEMNYSNDLLQIMKSLNLSGYPTSSRKLLQQYGEDAILKISDNFATIINDTGTNLTIDEESFANVFYISNDNKKYLFNCTNIEDLSYEILDESNNKLDLCDFLKLYEDDYDLVLSFDDDNVSTNWRFIPCSVTFDDYSNYWDIAGKSLIIKTLRENYTLDNSTNEYLIKLDVDDMLDRWEEKSWVKEFIHNGEYLEYDYSYLDNSQYIDYLNDNKNILMSDKTIVDSMNKLNLTFDDLITILSEDEEKIDELLSKNENLDVDKIENGIKQSIRFALEEGASIKCAEDLQRRIIDAYEYVGRPILTFEDDKYFVNLHAKEKDIVNLFDDVDFENESIEDMINEYVSEKFHFRDDGNWYDFSEDSFIYWMQDTLY